MAFRTSISAALLTALFMSGCMTTQKSSGLANPFSKGDFSALQKKRKKPLTQVAMEALRPKSKTPVKIVSPMDWFRGTSSTSETVSQATRDQLTNLAAEYQAATQRAAAGAAQKLAQPAVAAAQNGVSPLLSFNGETAGMATPAQVSMPSAPQNQLAQYQAMAQNAVASQAVPQFPTIPRVSNGLVTNGQAAMANPPASQTPQVNFQAARLPLGQPVANIQQTAAQYAVAANKNVANATSIAQTAMTQSVFPRINTRVQVPSAAAPQVPALTYPSAFQATNQTAAAPTGYPSTPQPALPNISTAVVQPRSPMYR